MLARWQRLPLLGLLWPLLWMQARHVRRITPRMPEPPGCRTGTAGHGSLVHLLPAGDSGVAGVGAPTQDQALCGHLVRRLSRHHTVQWCVLAVNGLDSPGLLSLLQDTPCKRFDVVLLSIGANDATRLCAPLQWARWQTRLAELIDQRFAPALLVFSAVPPMACLLGAAAAAALVHGPLGEADEPEPGRAADRTGGAHHALASGNDDLGGHGVGGDPSQRRGLRGLG